MKLKTPISEQEQLTDSFEFATGREILSTEGISQHEKLEYWHELIKQSVVPLNFSVEKGAGFDAALSHAEFGSISLSLISAMPHKVQRDRPACSQGGGDRLVFNFLLGGQMVALQDGVETLINPGHAALVNASRCYELNFTQDSQLAVVQMPKAMLAQYVQGLDRVVASDLARENPAFNIVSSFVKTLCQPEMLNSDMANKLADNLAGLLGTMVYGAAEQGHEDVSDHKMYCILRIKGFVEDNLTNDLNSAKVAESLRLSQRYINYLLRNEEISLARYILSRRLEGVAKDLVDPNMATRSISEIAYKYGFNNMAHMSRVFRKQFGIPPRDFRMQKCAV